jgi:hypothetical protein
MPQWRSAAAKTSQDPAGTSHIVFDRGRFPSHPKSLVHLKTRNLSLRCDPLLAGCTAMNKKFRRDLIDSV